MKELQILLRSLQLYAHQAHNLCARIVFHQDHEMFAEIYTKAESDYDSITERAIGLSGEEAVCSLQELLQGCFSKLSSIQDKSVKENSIYYQVILSLIKEINAKIEPLCKSGSLTQGTIQMLGDIADKNEVLLYKINQRLKK